MSGRGGVSSGVPDGGARWTSVEARQALAACERSGESVSAFARRHGLSAQRLLWWRKRLNRGGATQVPHVSLAPLVLRPTEATSAVRVELQDGVAVHVHDVDKTPASWLLAVVSGLRGAR